MLSRWCKMIPTSNRIENGPVAFISLMSSSVWIICGCMFLEVRNYLPSMAAWMEICYEALPILSLDDHSISNC